jgi:hypothetical protein
MLAMAIGGGGDGMYGSGIMMLFVHENFKFEGGYC